MAPVDPGVLRVNSISTFSATLTVSASPTMRLWLLCVFTAVLSGGIDIRAQTNGPPEKTSQVSTRRPLEGRCFRIETSNGSVVSGRVARATSNALIIGDKVHFPDEFAPDVRLWIFEGVAGPEEVLPRGIVEEAPDLKAVKRATTEVRQAGNARERSGSIHHAAGIGSTDDVSWFLSQGIPMGATNDVGMTAIQVAAVCNQLAVVKYLVSVGAKPDVVDKERHSLMHFAAAGDAVDILDYLSKQGLSVGKQDSYGGTPLHSAAAEGSLAAAEWLLQNGADVKALGLFDTTPLRAAVMFGHAGMVRLLVRHGADPNEEWCPTKETALYKALSLGYLDVCKALLEVGAAPKPPAGKSLLHAAACLGTVETMELLLVFRLNVDEETASGETALLKAAFCGNIPVMLWLLQHGANVNHVEKSGMSPLHAAALGGSLEAVKILVESGADRSLRSKERKTPSELAAEFKRQNIIQYLNSLPAGNTGAPGR